MMAPGSIVVLLLLLQSMVASWATQRDSFTRLWEDDEQTRSDERLFPATNPHRLLRGDRKLIFINNKALDMEEEEQARLWTLYLKKGYVPEAQNLDKYSHTDLLDAAMMTPITSLPGNSRAIGADTGARQEQMDTHMKARNDKVSDQTVGRRKSVSLARFVTNPDKVHLIEVVDEAELQKLRSTTAAPEIDQRDATEAAVESATVHYEATQVSVLSFIWTELKNLGELLGREMLDTISSRLWYLWRSLVKVVQARGRRAILDQSSEL